MRETVPAAEAVKASQGRLQKTLFVVVSTAADGLAPLKENVHAHLEYLAGLERSGQLFLAGPLFDEDPDAWSGDGLLVYNAADIDEARRIAEGDPMHRSGARRYTIRPWLCNDGALTLRVRLSDRSAALG